MKTVTLFTDGGCHGNPGPGGWAAILRYENRTRELSGSSPATTNNRMEIQAAIAGLSALREPCEVAVHTDSQYLRQGISQWINAWKARGWVTASKQPVKNADLWKELDAATRRHRVTWHWLKGHAGHEDNERCDVLAAAEIAKLRGSIPPEELARHLAEFVEQAPDVQQALL